MTEHDVTLDSPNWNPAARPGTHWAARGQLWQQHNSLPQ
jgi:hypothetical protein